MLIASDCKCGISKIDSGASSRIANGRDAKIEEFPWQVSIQQQKEWVLHA